MTPYQIAAVVLQQARYKSLHYKFLVVSAWYLLDATIEEAELFAGVLQ